MYSTKLATRGSIPCQGLLILPAGSKKRDMEEKKKRRKEKEKKEKREEEAPDHRLQDTRKLGHGILDIWNS